MTGKELQPADIEVFAEAVGHFFETTCGEKAHVRTAYLLDGNERNLWGDFNGMIDVRGGYVGSICFSAPRSLLSHVLLKMGERDFSEEHHLDIVGEIANIFSGRARRHFGEQLHISTPRTFSGRAAESGDCAARSTPYAIPLCWHGYEASLVVHLDVAAR